ncbi:MAG: DUF904 domain-containing protein [Thermodesulfobacteriota bacterium]
MGYENDLGRLEKIVEKLMANLDAIQQEKNGLAAMVRQLEEERKGLQQEVARLMEDKEQVKKRVHTLIGAVEKWEKAFAGANGNGAAAGEGPLFSAAAAAQEAATGSA